MQGVTVDAEHKPKLQNDEDVLNLRPSPNYKHKKYLSSKFGESMMIQAKSELNSKRENVSVVSSVAAQPPLPPNPPPPESPPMIMKLKKEIEDDEYSSSNPETATEFKQPDEAETENATIKTDLSEKGTMCRNFARGTCRKGTACRFVHELILSQLPGVYTFCRNFQNSVCSFPKCKFVHATVFEKEHFFRTGYLPPHTLAHLAEPSVLQPPPPPPQSEVKMPRTKRPVRKQKKSTDDADVLQKLNKFATAQKHRIDSRALMEQRTIKLAFTILLGSFSNECLQKTIGQLKTEIHLKEVTNTRSRRTRHSSRSASHDDGYLMENSSQGSGGGRKKPFAVPSSTSRSTAASRRSRSVDASSRKVPPSASRTVQRRRSRSLYRMPAYNKNGALSYPAIIPKVTPETPLTVLRQARQGEMVVSMSGSPVMVPSCYTLKADERANCNILLGDGTMLSLQPKQLRQSQANIPFSLMDPNVLAQLKTLKDNLDKVVKLGEKAIK